MFEYSTENKDAIRFSRLDAEEPFSTVSAHAIFLEEREWPTVEHYFQYNVVLRDSIRQKILSCATGLEAYELGNGWYRKKVKDWKKLRAVLMTRAVYTKCQMYEEVKEALLASENKKILETSLYDHYWGLGRDQRGENMLGKIWVNVREKIRSE